ncbi:lysine-specific demethylase JMJ25 isoform X2 [Helianthus annuus]|uniref:lysine-specific demethylase JMJ25 isoform X2 n=1 Tax=Helianthus annuus TaxID=4232 RepID=UPI000B8F07F9|nr:lysine-specific demethylase JMJ25 isoform X2 [Helianthus annuus]KAJ0519653.1 putative transcription factor C2H2 family [Helianthus annuus]
MANKDTVKKPSKSTPRMQRTSVRTEPEVGNSSKKRKKTSAKGVDEERKWCHQCRTVKEPVVDCTKCYSKRYCLPCITKWYPHVFEEEFVKACPVCCNNCNCKACLRRFSPKGGYTCSEPDKIKHSKQILHKVLPFATKLNQDQLMEKEIEAKVKGVSVSELHLQDAHCEVDDDIFCDNCGAYSFDFYRSCACGYDLCLLCCRELRDGQLKRMTIGWKARIDGSIPCPPKDIGGCNDGTLDLKRILSVNWIVNLLEKAQRVYEFNNSYDSPQTCMESDASYLYSLSAKDIQPQHMEHFKSHWSKGEPIIVNDVLSTSSGLSWEPMVLWRAFRDITKSGNAYEVEAIHCLDWSEVTVDLSKFCRGYSEAQCTKQGLPLILKLEDWKPSCLSQGEWPRHFVEFINCLPFKDYTNPHNGYLNVAVKLPDLSSKPDMGPKMDMAYGDSVTKLHYEKSDTVNVLTHTKSCVLTSTKLNKTKIVKEKHGDQQETLVCNTGLQRNESQQNAVDPMDGGALWDIFQRQDVAKLEEYLRNHSAEFRHTDCLSVEQVFHPIHDRTFYLNVEHKRKLKAEFGIEPWTFKQKLGDAVFIPAGCPYQVRNLKSCTKVELNFISPESLGECIRLQTELRMLPNNHIAKQQKLNIGKMMIYALDHVVSELSGFIDSNGPTDDLQDQFAKELEILNGMNMNNHTNGWISDSDSVIPPSVHQLAPIEDSGGDGMDINDYTDGWVCDSESEENSRYIRCVFPSLRPSLNHIVVHQSAATIEDPGTTEEEESVGLWQGNVIGQPGKKILQAVMHHYPETFQGVKIRSKPHWLSILKELHVFIKSFLETSVDALSEDHITSLEEDLSDFESFGFDLSWARKRVNIVKDLKFGNDPLRLELVVLEQSVAFLHKELVEANARLEKARLDYDRATYARNKKVDEMAHKFGAEYEDVLNGNLGFGMLPGY